MPRFYISFSVCSRIFQSVCPGECKLATLAFNRNVKSRTQHNNYQCTSSPSHRSHTCSYQSDLTRSCPSGHSNNRQVAASSHVSVVVFVLHWRTHRQITSSKIYASNSGKGSYSRTNGQRDKTTRNYDDWMDSRMRKTQRDNQPMGWHTTECRNDVYIHSMVSIVYVHSMVPIV